MKRPHLSPALSSPPERRGRDPRRRRLRPPLAPSERKARTVPPAPHETTSEAPRRRLGPLSALSGGERQDAGVAAARTSLAAHSRSSSEVRNRTQADLLDDIRSDARRYLSRGSIPSAREGKASIREPSSIHRVLRLTRGSKNRPASSKCTCNCVAMFDQTYNPPGAPPLTPQLETVLYTQYE